MITPDRPYSEAKCMTEANPPQPFGLPREAVAHQSQRREARWFSLTALLVLVLCLCGCSRGQGKSGRSPLDRLQAGRDVSFGHYVVRVAKRRGSSLEGVRVVSRERDGRTATITASRGTLSAGPNRSTLTLVLQDAQVRKVRQKASVGQLTLDLPVMGL